MTGFAAEGTTWCTVLLAIDVKGRLEEQRTDPYPGFVVDLAEVLLGIKGLQREEAVSCVVSI